MLSKEEFIKQLVWLKERDQREERFRKAISMLDPDSLTFTSIFNEWHSKFLEILKQVMEDGGDWISYYIYDLEWGTKAKFGTVKTKEGKNIPMKTLDDLYNILTKSL